MQRWASRYEVTVESARVLNDDEAIVTVRVDRRD